MIKRTLFAVALSTAVAFSVTGPSFAADKGDKDTKKSEAVKADDTKMNKQMRENKEMTADQQGNSPADRKMTQEIRRAVMKDKSLSTYGHNVKIITKDGNVTLKGPVRSAEEKAAVEKAAAQVAKGKITNQLQVMPPKDKDKEKAKEKKEKEKEKKEHKQEK